MCFCFRLFPPPEGRGLAKTWSIACENDHSAKFAIGKQLKEEIGDNDVITYIKASVLKEKIENQIQTIEVGNKKNKVKI